MKLPTIILLVLLVSAPYQATEFPSEPLDMALRSSVSILKRLRAVMKLQPEGITAYIVPSGDSHMSEYVSPADKRLAFVTGFTGSAGTAVITEEQAALWTDGRYHKQAERELPSQWTLMREGLPETLKTTEWLNKVLPAKAKVGADPLLMSYTTWDGLAKKLEQSGHKLIPINQNLIDQVWDDKPEIPDRPVEILGLNYSGKSWQEKVVEIRQDMKEQGMSALIVTALDEVAWLFNLRGSDIDFNPVFFAYAVVTSKSVHLFIDEAKMTVGLERHLAATSDAMDASQNGGPMQQHNGNIASPPAMDAVDIQPYWMFKDFLTMFVQQQSGKVWVSGQSSFMVVTTVPEERRLLDITPIGLRKSVKNSVEIACMKRAHVKDAAAVCQFLDWMEKEIPKGNMTELSACDKLEEFRKAQDDFVGLSFATIAASGPNAALIHYQPSEETNRPVTSEEMFLVDSGGQYRDGTTDVTRTVHFGVPTDKQKECFTRVVKGTIAMTTTKFPRLTKGSMLDTLARTSLWEVGLDYLHGTGHGVGMYLNVHEGPFSISYRHNANDPGLREGMITSIEPGYYEDDNFGIRLENMALIKKIETKYNFKDRPFLSFETITLVPIQKKLLVPEMLTADEMEWINTYHEQCRTVVGRLLEEKGHCSALQWLMINTQPIG